MLPAGSAPPAGVFPSKDGDSVAQPISLREWFLEFYDATRRTRADLIQFIANPGEIVFVPSGTWHCVINLDESFAVTQNYVSETTLSRTMSFLENKTDQISGIVEARRSTFAAEFLKSLPSMYKEALKASGDSSSWRKSVAASQTKSHGNDPKAGFSFAFQFQQDE